MRPDVGAALAELATARFFGYLGSAVVLQIVSMVALSLTVNRVTGAGEEMASNAVFRDRRDSRMLYPLLGSPLVGPTAVLVLAISCFGLGPSGLGAFSLGDSARFALCLWLASAFNGVLMDFSVFRVSWRILLGWWAGSLGSLLAIAYAMNVFYGDARGFGFGGAAE